MKKRFFRFITYVTVFLCLYNNAVSAADSLQPSSIFDGESRDEEVLKEIRREYERRTGVSSSAGEVQLSILYSMASREVREGILEKGVLIYEYILKLFPGEKDARIELASIWFGLGQFEKALSYIDGIGYKEGEKDYDADKAVRLGRFKEHILKALDTLEKKRELERKGYRTVVVPDGKGGYILDTIGFRGKWIFRDRANGGSIHPGYVLRLIKSLAFVIEQRSQLLGNIDNTVNEVILISGTDKKVVFQKKRNADGYRVFVSKEILNDSPQEQRALFSGLFNKRECHIVDTDTGVVDINIPVLSKDKRIISIALNKSLEEGRNLLSDLLTKEGFRIERENMGNDEDWGLMRLNSGDSEFSDIMERFRERAAPLAERIASNNFQAVCISIDSQSIEKAYMLIEEIRKRRPDIFIIIGGPLSSLPEQMISLLPGADAVIAGEADISLPRLFNLLSRDGREISPQDLVSATNGGFYLKSGNNIFIDNLYKTDKPEDIHMAVPYDDKRSETIFTSRGCPYSCTFCNLILGKKFRAVPVDEVIDWLIHKLALKMSAERKEEMAYDAVKKLLESGENLYSHGLRSPIMIDIWDDNFFINRNRVIALFNRIIEKGLNRYFTFVVEGVSLRAIQRNGRIDREILDLALRAGVTILKFGIDGFSRRNLIDFNKGYSQEDIVKAIFELHDIGFLVGTNIIDSSPRTFYSDMLEGLILFGILPAYYKVYDNPGVLGDLTNELTVYESLSRAGEMRWEKRHKIFGYHDEGSYMVPEAEEYAYRRYNLLRIYDEDTQQAARRMFSKDFNFIQHLTSEECKEAFPLVLKRWVSGECGPELKALGEIFIKLLDKYNGDIYKARARIIEDIRSLYCTGFVNLRELYERYGYGEDLDIKTVYRIDELDNLLNNAIRAREFGKAVRLADIASKISGDNLKYLYLGAAIDYIRYFYGDLGITLGDIIKNSGINIPLFYKDHMDRLSHRVTDYLVKRINGMHLGFPDEASGMTSPDVWKGFTENMSIIADNIIEALRFINGETQIPVYKPLKVKVVNKKQALEEYAKASFKELMQEPLEEEGAASDFTRMLSYESGMRRLAGLDDIGDQLGELYGRTEEKGKLTDILLDSLIRDMEFKHDNFTPFNERRVYKNHFNYCTVLQPEQEDILIGTLGYDYYDEDKGDFVIFFKGEKEEETEDGGKERKVYIGMMSLDEYLNFNVNHLKGFIPGTLKAGVVYSKEGTDEILRVKELLGYENIDFIDFHIDSPWLNIAVTEDGFCIMDRREDSIIVNRTWHELETDLFIKEKVVVSQGGSSTDIITVWDGKSDLTQLLKDADIVILGAPDSTGTKRNLGLGGSEKAPDKVIDELLRRDLSRLKGLKVVYLGNIKIPETDKITRVTRKDGQDVSFPDALLDTYDDIKSVVSGVLKINPNIRLVQIGGDHGNAYPFNAPFSDGRGRLGFINVDAHFDTRDPKDPTRPEGPNSGTPFRYLLEEGHTPPRNAAFLGIDKDNPYAASLEEWVRSVGVENIVPYQEVMRRWKEDRANFAQFIDELLEKVVLGVDTGHISFCIDVVNEDEAPGCSARNKNGLSADVVGFIARRAGMNKKFRSLGVFEIIPELDTDNKTIRLGADIIVEYLNGNKPPDYAKAMLSLKAESKADALLLTNDRDIVWPPEIEGASLEEIGNMFALIKNPSSSKDEILARQEMIRVLLSQDWLNSVSTAKENVYSFLDLVKKLIRPEGEHDEDKKPFIEKLSGDPRFDKDKFISLEGTVQARISRMGYKPEKGSGAERVIKTLIELERYEQAVPNLIVVLRKTENDILKAIAGELEEIWELFPARDAISVIKIKFGETQLQKLKLFNEKIGAVVLFAGLARELDFITASFNETRPAFYKNGWNFVSKKGKDEQVKNDSGVDTLVRLITGSNMSGKSHFLAQNLFVQLMAQSFGYIPAEGDNNIRIYERIAYVDRANTEAMNNLSAFGSEVEKWKRILAKEPNNRTLIISDEAFSTTSPEDQFKLLKAVRQYLSTRGARFLLANHNEEFIVDCETDPAISLYHLKIRIEDDGKVKLFYELSDGKDDSHAIEIARKLGLPEGVIQSAEDYLAGKKEPVSAKKPKTRRVKGYTYEQRERLKGKIGDFMEFFPSGNGLVISEEDKSLKWRYAEKDREDSWSWTGFGRDRNSLGKAKPRFRPFLSLFSVDADFNAEWGGISPEELGIKRYGAVMPYIQNMLQGGKVTNPKELLERQKMFRALIQKGVFERIEASFWKIHHAMYAFLEELHLLDEHYNDFNIFLLDKAHEEVRERGWGYDEREKTKVDLFFNVLSMNIRICGIDTKSTGIDERLELLQKLQDLNERWHKFIIQNRQKEEEIEEYLRTMRGFENELTSLVEPIKSRIIEGVDFHETFKIRSAEIINELYQLVRDKARTLSLLDEDIRETVREEVRTLMPLCEKIMSQSIVMSDSSKMIVVLNAVLDEEDIVESFVNQLRNIDSVCAHQMANYFEMILRHWFGKIKKGTDILRVKTEIIAIRKEIEHFKRLPETEPFEKIMEIYLDRIMERKATIEKLLVHARERLEGLRAKAAEKGQDELGISHEWDMEDCLREIKEYEDTIKDLQYLIDLYGLEEGKKPKRDNERIKKILGEVILRFEIRHRNEALWPKEESIRFNNTEFEMINSEFYKFLAVILYGYIIREFGFAEAEYTDDLGVVIKKGWGLTMGRDSVKDERNIKDRQVRNDVTLGVNELIKIISGTNMSGKTFLEKMIIWNILSAQVSGFAPAEAIKMPLFSRIIYLDRVTEKMFRDLSSYGHEVEFWKAFFKLLDDVEGPFLVLGVTDELFSTTSPLYQSALSYGVASEVLRRGGLMVVSSHNHDFIDAFRETYPDDTKIWHLRTRIEREDGDVKVHFDHVLEEGHDLSNAIDVAESMGLGMITSLVKKEEMTGFVGDFLAIIKTKAQSCKDLDEELVLAVDTDIGNLREYAGELMDEIARLKVDNVRIFIGPGASLKEQLQGYLGDRKNCVISVVLKNTNCSLFDDIKDRIRITAVEDSDFHVNYIPIIPIIELAIRQAVGEDVAENYKWLPNVRDVREVDGMLIIYLLPKSKPMSVDDLRERYRNEAVVLSSA